MNYEQLHNCLNILASSCDGAHAKDGMGFNKFDTMRGRKLAETPIWGYQEAKLAFAFVQFYKKQLIASGIDVESIPKPEPEFHSLDQLIERLESIPVAFFARIKQECHFTSSFPSFFWDVYKAQKEAVKEAKIGCTKYLDEWYFYMIPRQLEIEEKIEEKIEVKIDPDTQKFGSEISEKIEETPDLDVYIASTNLYSYQKPHTKALITALQQHNVVADTSDTGTGKTFCAPNSVQYLQKIPFVVCPKAIIPGWIRSFEVLGISNYHIANYELAIRGKEVKIASKKIKGSTKKVLSYTSVESDHLKMQPNPKAGQKYQPKKIFSWENMNDICVIFDEAHRGKNRNTQNSLLMLTAATSNSFKIMLLSATLGEDSLKMYGTGAVLKLWDANFGPDYYRFAREFGARKVSTRYASFWESGTTPFHMDRMRKMLGDKLQGMRKDELVKLGLFPNCQILAEAYNINGKTQDIIKEYEALGEAFAELEEKERNSGSTLALLQKALQKVELLKTPAIVEMATDGLDNGESIAIFCNYTETLLQTKELLEKEGYSVSLIYGGQSAAKNEEDRVLFQENKNRVIVCNIQAAREGIDLHDVHHTNPRHALIHPSWSAQNLKQVLGRVDRAGGSASLQRIVFAANTQEEEVCSRLQAKLDNIGALNDQDMSLF